MKLQIILSVLLIFTINVFDLIGCGEATVHAAEEVKDATAVKGEGPLRKQSSGSRPSQGLIINWDCTEWFVRHPKEEMTIKGVQALIDQYVGTQVSTIFFNPTSQRTAYASKVRESFWDKNEKVNHAVVTNTRLLHQKGIDPYLVWIARCREKNISPWISMRMNDLHSTDDPNAFTHGSFWREHPEYRRVPGSKRGYSDQALDYSVKEVRDHNMALIRELLERCDPDGFELDFMRSSYHFKPGHEKQGVQVILEFIRQVRQLTNEWAVRRGHPIMLAVRLPAVPEYARGMGLDGIAWARAGLVDMLIPTPFWETADFDIPMEQWRELLGPQADKVILAAGMEGNIRGCRMPSELIVNDCEPMRGFTAAMLDRGADQIYLFNHFTTPSKQGRGRIFHEAGRLETVIDKPRRHIVTFHDIVPPGVVKATLLPFVLKSPLYPAQFRIYTGPALSKGKVTIRVGLAQKPDVNEVKLAARMNSVECTPLADNMKLDDFPISKPKRVPHAATAATAVKRVLQFDVPVSAMQRGYNLVEVFLTQKTEQKIVWVEVYIVPNS